VRSSNCAKPLRSDTLKAAMPSMPKRGHIRLCLVDAIMGCCS
jgi:hypothetical protein